MHGVSSNRAASVLPLPPATRLFLVATKKTQNFASSKRALALTCGLLACAAKGKLNIAAGKDVEADDFDSHGGGGGRGWRDDDYDFM
mmetsp:Transcript_63336/g.188603  ORF Transcript_63336/g.188603 Transcript_63336/m.188603 type:complete len:87 (+) Transcript_63336:1-261(+)|eukprot:6513672-Prymnesium_polylepis.2